MVKVAFFVEGQAERIFIEKLIEEYFSYPDYDIISTQLIGDRLRTIRKSRGKSKIEYFFYIFDASCDNRVLSAIIERADNLFKTGVLKIFGIRDLYPDKRADKQIILKKINDNIKNLNNFSNIIFIIAIMEIEAWFLLDTDLFKKIHSTLAVEYIKEQLNIDLTVPDTERFEHPAGTINSILNLINQKYKKREKQAYEIISRIDYTKLCADKKIRQSNKSFYLFLTHFEKITELNTDWS